MGIIGVQRGDKSSEHLPLDLPFKLALLLGLVLAVLSCT